MRWTLFCAVLVFPAIVLASGGVNGVETPAEVNSVAEPDKVCGVSGLAGSSGSSQNDPFFAEGSVILLQSTGATPTVYFGSGGVYVSHEN